jgi:hypothetical protein
MPRKKRSEATLAQLKMDRLKNHLIEVERIIGGWVSELNAPSPFHWSESKEAIKFETEKAAMPVRLSLAGGSGLQKGDERSQWALQTRYAPPTEQDAVANHMLRKHLRKRAIWSNHAQWELTLKRVTELAPAASNKVSRLVEVHKGRWETTEDYEGTVMEKALDLATGQEREEPYWQKPGFSHGVWYGDILIEKSAGPEEVAQVASDHRQLIQQAAQSEEMLSVAVEWGEVLKLQARMKELASKTLKSSDILYPCQFCRRLW